MLKNKSESFLLLVLLSGVASLAGAGEWTGEGELGFTSTSGNTDSESLNAKFGIGKKYEKWEHNAKLNVLRSSNSGVDSADSTVFTEKTEYRFAEKTFAFGRIRYEQDEFSGFEYQSVISIGVGHIFLNAERHKLEASAGAGYRDFENDLDVKTQEVVFDGQLKYAYIISETSTFNQNLFIEEGSSNTYTKSETFLKLVVVGNLGAKFGYEVKRNSNVPAGTEKTDTITTATLVYSF